MIFDSTATSSDGPRELTMSSFADNSFALAAPVAVKKTTLNRKEESNSSTAEDIFTSFLQNDFDELLVPGAINGNVDLGSSGLTTMSQPTSPTKMNDDLPPRRLTQTPTTRSPRSRSQKSSPGIYTMIQKLSTLSPQFSPYIIGLSPPMPPIQNLVQNNGTESDNQELTQNHDEWMRGAGGKRSRRNLFTQPTILPPSAPFIGGQPVIDSINGTTLFTSPLSQTTNLIDCLNTHQGSNLIQQPSPLINQIPMAYYPQQSSAVFPLRFMGYPAQKPPKKAVPPLKPEEKPIILPSGSFLYPSNMVLPFHLNRKNEIVSKQIIKDLKIGKNIDASGSTNEQQQAVLESMKNTSRYIVDQVSKMDMENITVHELKTLLKAVNHPSAGKKCDLLDKVIRFKKACEEFLDQLEK